MGKRKYPLLPVEVIEKVVIGEPEAVERVLHDYAGYQITVNTSRAYQPRYSRPTGSKADKSDITVSD